MELSGKQDISFETAMTQKEVKENFIQTAILNTGDSGYTSKT